MFNQETGFLLLSRSACSNGGDGSSGNRTGEIGVARLLIDGTLCGQYPLTQVYDMPFQHRRDRSLARQRTLSTLSGSPPEPSFLSSSGQATVALRAMKFENGWGSFVYVLSPGALRNIKTLSGCLGGRIGVTGVLGAKC